MRLGIIGLGHAFLKQFNAIKKTKQIQLVAICDIEKDRLDRFSEEGIFKTTNYQELVEYCDYVLIASPPDTHFEIAYFFINHGIGIFIEKPIVIGLKELRNLENLLKLNDSQYYNTLHFSFGEEILWFKKNVSKFSIPNKIKVFISDKYVENKHIKEENLSLNGAYLDETINPLSAIANIFGYNLKSNGLTTKSFINDKYDYFAYSHFILNDKIPIEIEVDWNKNSDEKFIDLFYDDFTIRLNSKDQNVENLTTGEILFKSKGDRMVNHYLNSFKEYFENGENKEISFKLHRELLNNYEN